MRAVTGIELGSGRCVLACVRPGSEGLCVSAVHGLQGDADLPDADRGAYLKRVRRDGGFPRRARVVAWGLPDGTPRDDVQARAAVAPLVEAGFAIDAVLSPPEALAHLSRQRPRLPGRAATAWLSLNCHAAAIAIVDGGELLFSRVFDWNYRTPATVREELLQRYSLVAHLAPELRHGFDVVREQHGVPVDAIVTCGDLPDLRSLTMPLIEELDMEVETLDSLDGLEIAGRAGSQGLRERMPAVRLACAVAAGDDIVARRGVSPVVVAAVAAGIIVLLSAAYIGVSRFRDQNGAQATAPPPPVVAANSPVSSASPRAETASPSSRVESPPPVPVPQPGVDLIAPERIEKPVGDATQPLATMGRRGASAQDVTGSQPETARAAPGQSPSPSRTSAAPPVRPADPRAGDVDRSEPAPLNEPLPAVNSILVSPDRRLAVLNGVIVREGDAVGSRVLIRIEPGAVVLKEPSGREVRVPIRHRVGTDVPR